MNHERFVILCVAGASALGGSLRNVVATLTDHQIEVETCADDTGMWRRLGELETEGAQIPMVLAADHVGAIGGLATLEALRANPRTRGVRTLFMTQRPADATDAVTAGSIDAVVPVPWNREALEETIDRLLTGYFIERSPEALEQLPEIVDVGLLSHAFTESQERGRSAQQELGEARRGVIAYTDLSDGEVEAAMIEEIDRVLDHPERKVYAKGTLLLESGNHVDGIRIVLDGRLSLFLDVDGEEVPFHVRTVGRILGIFALARHEPAFFSCRADTDVTVIPVTVEQLDHALRRSPSLGGLFTSVLLRSMVRRNKRSVELRLQVNRLATQLRRERDQLAEALQRLDAAQSQLVEQEKMALLGQLVAGVGHELNNPVAAILRATEYVEADVTELTTRHPEASRFTEALLGALHAEPTSTREQRRQRRALAAAIGDDALARRLIRAGITTPQGMDDLFAGVDDAAGRDDLLDAVEAYRRLGNAIRNLRTGARRIEGLVGSLRSYARRPKDMVDDVDVREGLDETLLLLGHQMRNITVERRYEDVPLITARPGELNQVWTNIIVNAIQIMEGQGTLEVVADAPEPGRLRVQIVDSGPGISPEDVDRIFDLSFTTKQGRVDFGLGLGLRIAQNIVNQHHGSIDVESKPGRTCFAITLPVGGPGGKETAE